MPEEEWDVWSCDYGADGYRLPTDAEWEYACRAGTTSEFVFGGDESLLPRFGYYFGNSKDRTWPGGSLLPSLWGLFDMYGNVWEWCADWYGGYAAAAMSEDPRGPADGSDRVYRGGCWFDVGECRSASRLSGTPSHGIGRVGFRVAASASGK